jgi:hypothetical protein
MLGDDLDAASAAYRVGYNNASHFNREYKSLFGAPPNARRATAAGSRHARCRLLSGSGEGIGKGVGVQNGVEAASLLGADGPVARAASSVPRPGC